MLNINLFLALGSQLVLVHLEVLLHLQQYLVMQINKMEDLDFISLILER